MSELAPESGALFLTGLELGARDDTRAAPARGDGPAGCEAGVGSAATPRDAAEHPRSPLKPFVCPPPPLPVARKQRYYSLTSSEQSGPHGMPEWERRALLARLRRPAPVDEAEFQCRLSRTRSRNADSHLQAVQQHVRAVGEAASRDRWEAFLVDEERRSQIFERHKNLSLLREEERFCRCAQRWRSIIVAHVFLTALLRERRTREAFDAFARLLAPMVSRFLRLRRRREEACELTRANLRSIPFPTPQVIQSMYGTFFSGWSPLLLERLVANATPHFLAKGSFLMHEGDIGRVMFMITTGTVSIILRKKGKDKRRSKANSSGVFQITAPCYVGEFALVCKEPRSASILCETDIGYWAVRPEDYEEVAAHLSVEVASKQREATDVRRRQNLKKFFPLTVGFLRKFSYFEQFSDASLAKAIDAVDPLVLHDGDYLFKSGEMDSSAYFVQDGLAVEREAGGAERNVATGSCIGVFECSCGVNERKRTSIVSVNYCDVWRMRRETLVDIGMTEPAALLHCRVSAKADRALSVVREPKAPLFVREDAYLAFCLPPALIGRLYDMCVPAVYLNGERLTVMGQPAGTLVILLSGCVDVVAANSGEQESFRVDVAERRRVLESVYSRSAASGRGKRRPLSGAGRADGAAGGGASQSAALTLVLGAYEFASGTSQYLYTATSLGLTEALCVEKRKLEAALPSHLREILHDNSAARDVVVRAYKRRSLEALLESASLSFARAFRDSCAGELGHSQRRGRP